jgi:hypothetical protein
MSSDASDEIQLVTRADDYDSRTALDYITKPLKVDELRQRFREFMSGLQSIVDVEEAGAGGFQLTEIQFSAEISANGEFKLVGSGVGVEASSAVTFVLQRKSSGGDQLA